MFFEFLVENKIFHFSKRTLRVVATRNKWLKKALLLALSHDIYIFKYNFHFLNNQTESHVVVCNPFYFTGLFLYPLKASENQWFSDVFREYRVGQMV